MASTETLQASLAYEPRELKFGTSGRRGDVVDLTQLEVYLNATAELEYLQSLSKEDGGISLGDEFFYACDLRPSSTHYVPEERGRGELAQAIERAIRDAGMRPVNLGHIPTPALTSYATERDWGSIMVTGSHIPFDRNGYKTNTAHGELLKKDEAPITAHVAQVRARLYAQPAADALFDPQGRFKAGHQDLAPETDAARVAYQKRYTDFFAGQSLAGRRVLVYQHSAVGRDLLVETLGALRAEVIPAGRSDTFVPIDTENIDDAQLAVIQRLADDAAATHGPLDAVVSTDGDSDRPLVLGVQDGTVHFFGGDLLGMIVAEYLGADAVVVPISCNDAIDRGDLKDKVQPKTRIGSPYVIAGMERARAEGKQVVCGWEANGGFLVGSAITRNGHTLSPLPTRDAFLPILSVLFASLGQGLTLTERFARLPQRYSKAALLKKFPRATSLKIVESFSPTDASVQDVTFPAPGMEAVREQVAKFFPAAEGFGEIVRLNYTDGVRVYFGNGDVAHIRPSGNADELRIYAVADTQIRADEIARLGVAEPDGILRRMERAVV